MAYILEKKKMIEEKVSEKEEEKKNKKKKEKEKEKEKDRERKKKKKKHWLEYLDQLHSPKEYSSSQSSEIELHGGEQSKEKKRGKKKRGKGEGGEKMRGGRGKKRGRRDKNDLPCPGG